jgi:hypothetical protein
MYGIGHCFLSPLGALSHMTWRMSKWLAALNTVFEPRS